MSIENNLRLISELYKTDKLEHGYIEIYDSYFKDLRNKELKVLEIGVADGKSLLTWSDYFKNSTIIGIDIHKIDINPEINCPKCQSVMLRQISKNVMFETPVDVEWEKDPSDLSVSSYEKYQKAKKKKFRW